MTLRTALFFAALASACGTRSIFGDPADSGSTPQHLVRDAAQDLGVDVTLSADAGFQDGLPDVVSEACSDAPPDPLPPPGPIPHLCVPATDFECDGLSDSNALLPNGQFGNGFDDDCDGKVDEQCACKPGDDLTTTKSCWLVPATQLDPATGEPVGWCKTFSHGSVACTRSPGDATRLVWAGTCEGASPPFASDLCAPGDFDCDGAESNSRIQDCTCER